MASDVESQITQAMQGLLAGQAMRQQNGGRGPMSDPRVLQQLLTMEREKEAGLDKERERLQKEQMRQEKRATLGVLLDDAMQRRQAEENFQRQIQLQENAYARQREAQAEMEAAELARLDAQKASDAESTRRLESAKARQKKAMLELFDLERQAGGTESFVSKNLNIAGRNLAKIAGRTAAWHNEANTRLTGLAASVIGEEVSKGAKYVGGGYNTGAIRVDDKQVTGGQKPQAAIRTFAEGISGILVSGGANQAQIQHAVEGVMLAASDTTKTPEMRAAKVREATAALVEMTGERGIALVRAGLKSIEDLGSGTTERARKKTVELFSSVSNVLGMGVAYEEWAPADPEAMFDMFMSQVGAALTDPNGTPESREAASRKVVDNFMEGLDDVFIMDEESEAEMRGALSEAIARILPLDEQIRYMNQFMIENQMDEESEALKDVMATRARFGDSISSHLLGKTRNDLVPRDWVKKEAGSETTGAGETSTGPEQGAGTDGPES